MNLAANERLIRRVFFVVFVSVVLIFFFCSRAGEGPRPCLGLLLFLFLVAPGFLPALVVGRKLALGFLETVALAASFSLGQAALFLLASDWISGSALNAKWPLFGSTLVWFTWFEVSRRRKSGFRAEPAIPMGSPGGATMLPQFGFVVLLIFVFFLLLGAGAPMQWQADSAAHISAIRGVMEEGRVFPIHQPYGPTGAGKPDPRFGVFHALCALLATQSGIEPHTLWRILPAVVSPVLLLGFFFAAKSMTGASGAALIAASLFPLCYGGIGSETLRTLGYPTRISMLVYFVSLGVLFRYLRDGWRWLLWLLGVLIATCTAIHVYYFIEFLFAVSCFFFLKLLLDWRGRSGIVLKWVEVIYVPVIVSSPFLLYRFLTSYSTPNQYSIEGQGILYLGGLHIVNPLSVYGWLGYAGVASILILPHFLARARRSNVHMFVSAVTLGPLFVVLNPLLMPLATKTLSYLALRLIWAVPYVLSLGVFLAEVPRSMRDGVARTRVLYSVGLVVVLCALTATAVQRIAFYGHTIGAGEKRFPENIAALSEAFGRLDREVVGRRVFLSDPVTAYAIPALTRHFVTAIPVAHSAPDDPFPVSRVRDAQDVLSPSVDLQRSLAILRRYQVEFVVVNTAFAERLSAFEYEIDPDVQRACLAKIASTPAFLQPVFSEDGIHLFRVTNIKSVTPARADPVRGQTAVATGVESGVAPEKPPEAGGVADFSGQFLLENVAIRPDAGAAGDTVKIEFLWKCVSPLQREEVYKLFIRLDTEFPKGRFFAKAFEKPYRKYLERRTGRKFRFKVDVNPEDFKRPLHLWQRGELVRERVVFTLPTGLFPGTYRVKASLKRTTPATNYRLSDYLTDEDYYSGVEIGSVIIQNGSP